MRRVVGTVLLAAGLALAFGGTARADDASCVTAAEQSLTLRKSEKLHDALKQLAICVDPACPTEVKEECKRRIINIDAVMPSIILAAKDPTGNDLGAVSVSMDGAPLTTMLDGRPLSVDPGEHAFRFEVQGQPPIDKTLVIREGEKDRRESIVIGTAPPPTTPEQAPSFWNAQRALGLVSGGVGVVGIGLGVVFGAFAISSQNQEKTDCPAPNCLHYEQSLTDYDYANRNATAATIAFIVGGVLAAGGVVLWFTAPKKVRVAPVVSPQSAGLSVGGVF